LPNLTRNSSVSSLRLPLLTIIVFRQSFVVDDGRQEGKKLSAQMTACGLLLPSADPLILNAGLEL
jgi:hypothetical protein